MRRRAAAVDDVIVEVRGQFTGLHIVDLLHEDPAPDDGQVFAAFALEVVGWYGKVRAHREVRSPKFVRALCAALSDRRAVDHLQALL